MNSRRAMPVRGTSWELMGRPSLLTGRSLTSATLIMAWARLALCSSTGSLQVSLCQPVTVRRLMSAQCSCCFAAASLLLNQTLLPGLPLHAVLCLLLATMLLFL